ncbi:preprotein translocase subunit SecA [Candidatus Roizmanbacteria bacterium RIFCSPHIGHO2_02_FULL_37_13b]|uniref:Protein translocase subunit SecA n=1 Tax=Candidatus Roizmanbacteria bacterium RIFCSPLOWO2_02_FULL_36_11 TaxID=1802071 RepID=A0A1F7JFP0_9BACT|nr:MAG: preprotein translocase subunit SecA [Candidatus Roizmanbacteria bacterium RIFCSPHIGHO2_02_FULL_37_13b]OGK54447.1 MAG: preprotein translocase subunit SecA [Candidatus Roizmanbacteria bacterium RIFCSPLOWO2_02_FULL_36_11]
MLNIFSKFLDFNQREVNKLKIKVDEINKFEDKVRNLKTEDFKVQTDKLRHQIRSGEKTIDEIMSYGFALVREMSRRTLGERHYDVQMMAAVALHEGKVAEQRTGEGKTLSATAPLYLNALSGKGAHLVTVNDYLARRDTGWMGQIFHSLGMTISALISDKSYIYDPEFIDSDAYDWRLRHLRQISRKEAYECDITYGINSEFGFDYLRDNMNYDVPGLVQRDFNYAIIDEVDSVLIDEARTPHIISAPYDEDTSKYYKIAQLVKRLNGQNDYIIDEKSRTAHLTESGVKNVEGMLGVSNVYEKDFDTVFHIEAALKAETLFKKDKDYIVKDNEVIIVDEFTGRLLVGRRFSEGLHQAIEAKENVSIKRESRTLATVSLQNYFRMYKKLAGMTGTAATEAEEFNKIYKLEVVVLPTNRTSIRRDQSDVIYKTERAKYNAVAEEIANNHKIGRPVLVGTTSIEKNEYLSSLLKKKGVNHELLNAKNHEREATIIAKAGQKDAVTVATNMAGRGVDIILGGEPPNKYLVGDDKKSQEEYEKKSLDWRGKHDKVIELGGLYVIGTERHESRRIDNQLRGRAGRQGDPGETRFFVGLEDDLMRIFGGEQVTKLMNFFNFPEDQPLEHGMVSKALEQAQVKVEGFNFDIRKHLVDYDDVLNKQREIVYKLRRKMLLAGVKTTEEELKQTIIETFTSEIVNLVNINYAEDSKPDIKRLSEEISLIIPENIDHIQSHLDNKPAEEVQQTLIKMIETAYLNKEKEIGKDLWHEVIKNIFLTTIDKYWTEHLTAIDDLREGINLRGYAQLDPLIEYKNEAFSMFEKLLSDIDYEITRRILRVQLVQTEDNKTHVHSLMDQPVTYKSASNIDPYGQTEKKSISSPARQVQSAPQQIPDQDEPNGDEIQQGPGFRILPSGSLSKKPGRNDPCWCGSGKKYKKCHYPN